MKQRQATVEGNLACLEKILRATIVASEQSSYARRAPSKRTIPIFEALIAAFEYRASQSPSDPRVWQLLSLSQECVFRYTEAEASLRRSIALASSQDRRLLKRLKLLQEAMKHWEAIGPQPEQLKSLGAWLEARETLNGFLSTDPLAETKLWLKRNRMDVQQCISQLTSAGFHSDFSILNNLVRG